MCIAKRSNQTQFYITRSLISASYVLKQRQMVIRIADESDKGLKVINEYIQKEVASDKEDQNHIHRAQSSVALKI